MLNLAVIGAGNWGRNLIRVFDSLDDVNVDLICDTNSAATDGHLNVGIVDFPEAVMCADYIDAVVIATPSPTHYDLAAAAIEAGKHVFVEKPMTMNVGDAESLVASAANRNVKLMVGHLLEYHPAVDFMDIEAHAGNSVGKPFCIHTQRLNNGIVRTTENAWWSLAPHDISVACYLFDATPTTVSATSLSHRRMGIPDMVWATLVFPENRVAHIHVSWSDSRKTRKITMIGPRGSVVWNDVNPTPRVDVWTGKGYPRTPIIPDAEPLRLECQHFIDCIVDDETPRSDGADGLRVVKVLAAGEASLREGGNLVEVNL